MSCCASVHDRLRHRIRWQNQIRLIRWRRPVFRDAAGSRPSLAAILTVKPDGSPDRCCSSSNRSRRPRGGIRPRQIGGHYFGGPVVGPLNQTCPPLSLLYTAIARRRMRTRWLSVLVLLLASALLVSGAAKDCTFLSNPQDFADNTQHRQKIRSDLGSTLQRYIYGTSSAAAIADAPGIPRKNFIDDSIFSRMATAAIQPAHLASDADFLRRVTLDLTGRIPSGADVQAFIADTK